MGAEHGHAAVARPVVGETALNCTDSRSGVKPRSAVLPCAGSTVTPRIRFSPFLTAGLFLVGALRLGAAQVPFGESTVSSSALGARAVVAADVDGDGDLDVLSASSGDGKLAWYENGAAFALHTIAATPAPWSIGAGDVDGDGDVDAFATGPGSGNVLWYANTTGNGASWTLHTVATGLAGARFVSGADVDRDGDLDLVAASATDATIAWHENLAPGNGTAWAPHVVSTFAAGASGVVAGDLDGDGDPDLLAASRDDDTIAWYENGPPGNGTVWGFHVISTAADGAASVQAVDLDGDGDLDALSASALDGKLAWYENAAGNASVWSTHTLSTSVPSTLTVFAHDLDGDGDLDVLSATQTGDAVVWLENAAGDASSFVTHTISTTLDNPLGVFAADLDGDGDGDALVASFLDDRITWLKNDTLHRSACFVPLVDVPASALLTALNADVDGDGDDDLAWASSTDGLVVWDENTAGDGSSWTAHTVATGLPGTKMLSAGDLDRDGDLDLVLGKTNLVGSGAGGAGIFWRRNEGGAGLSWTALDVRAVSFALAEDLVLADVDGDGDLDVFAGFPYDSFLEGWQENTAGNASAFTSHHVGTFPGYHLAAGDLDGDGDLDVAWDGGDSNVTYRVGWLRNQNGAGDFSGLQTIQQLTPTSPLRVADLDGDGDEDVVQAGVGWYENLLGNGSSWTPRVLGASAGTGKGLALADLDGDGDLDSVAAGSAGLLWGENLNGAATSWASHPLAAGGAFQAALATDIDRDGDRDVVSGSSTALGVWRNQGGQVALAAASIVPPNPANGQIVPVLRLEVTHLGRAGDGALELASLGLLFEEQAGDALTTAEANALIQTLIVHRDANGNGVFDPGVDPVVGGLATLSLSGGVQTLVFADGDPNVQVVVGSPPAAYFVVVELTPSASTQVPNQFRVTHLALGAQATRAEDAAHDLPLAAACPQDVASAIVGPVTPVELHGFTLE